MMWKIQQAMQDDAIRTARIHLAIHPGNRDKVFIWQNFQPAFTEISVGKTEIAGTEPARPLIRTHRKFYKGFRGKARSRKPGQPRQPGSYEKACFKRRATAVLSRLDFSTTLRASSYEPG